MKTIEYLVVRSFDELKAAHSKRVGALIGGVDTVG